jgi:hypothetical protein
MVSTLSQSIDFAHSSVFVTCSTASLTAAGVVYPRYASSCTKALNSTIAAAAIAVIVGTSIAAEITHSQRFNTTPRGEGQVVPSFP